MRECSVGVIHAHHSHDHWLAAVVSARSGASVVRTFHNAAAVKGGAEDRGYALERAIVAVAAAREASH